MRAIQDLGLRSRISPTNAGLAFPLLNFIIYPLSELSAATFPDL